MNIVAVDPGWSTGIVSAEWNQDTYALDIEKKVQVEGGLKGLIESGYLHLILEADLVVCESFIPRPMARNYRLIELEPLRIEGYLKARVESEMVWREPGRRKLVEGTMTQSGHVIKAMGLWTLPSEVGFPDANDVNSAMMHLVAYLRDIGDERILEGIERAAAS